jgi:type I restriction enzyme R subunit
MITEADTCRLYVLPKLDEAGWNEDPHSFTEQKTFTDGRIVVAGSKTKRRPQKRADYLLRYTRDFMIAVVEAKPTFMTPGDGLQQAKEYAEILGLKFAYSTNGNGIVEFDYTTGRETELDAFPSPKELLSRLIVDEGMTDEMVERLLAPFNHISGKSPRYYQEIAINRAVQSVLQDKRRSALDMETYFCNREAVCRRLISTLLLTALRTLMLTQTSPLFTNSPGSMATISVSQLKAGTSPANSTVNG